MPARRPLVLAPLLVVNLLGCLRPAAPTVQLQAFLGASEEGGYEMAEVTSHPGEPQSARRVIVGPDGKVASSQTLASERAQQAIAAALAGTAGRRTAEDSLGGMEGKAFSRERARVLEVPDQLPASWPIEPVPGLKAQLAVERRAEGGLLFRVQLEGGGRAALLSLPELEGGALESVLLLPEGHLALARFWASSAGAGRHRLEGLAQLELGKALASLLNARAIDELKQGQLAAARGDLEQAIRIAPEDALARYNLACALTLEGSLDQALLTLGRAVDQDPDLRREAVRDPDFAALRGRVEFRLMVEPRAGEEL